MCKESKRSWAISRNLELQLVDLYIEKGVIPAIVESRGKVKRVFIQGEYLSEGEHYVRCPYCGKGLAEVTTKHYQACSGFEGDPWGAPTLGSEWIKSSRKFDDKKKKAVSEALLRTFEKGGEELKKKYSRASKESSRRPEVYAKKIQSLQKFRSSEEGKALQKKWAEDAHKPGGHLREGIKRYVRENPEKVAQGAAHARKSLQKTSALHLDVKKAMVRLGFQGFETEGSIGYYSVDEVRRDRKVVVEIDGCYWHGCDLCGREAYADNKGLDQRKSKYLINRGWKVIRVKECEYKKKGESYLRDLLIAGGLTPERGLA